MLLYRYIEKKSTKFENYSKNLLTIRKHSGTIGMVIINQHK